MAFAPLAPTVHFPPLEIAPETFLIQQVQEACGQPLFVYLNSMVILGRELTIKNLLALLTRAELDCPMTPPGRSEPLGIALARKRATS